jgi:hypothetical protein
VRRLELESHDPGLFREVPGACLATHFFKSVEVRGMCAPVEDRNEPAHVRRRIIERLRERGAPRDLDTAREIERTLEADS